MQEGRVYGLKHLDTWTMLEGGNMWKKNKK